MILRRRSVVILSLFVVAMLLALWVIVQALSPSVDGKQRTVTAEFTDASGLTVGNDVRQLGVRVGKVSSVQLHDNLARVEFTVADSVTLYDNTKIAIRYLNLVGQRYLDMFTDGPGSGVSSRSQVITTARTIGSFDITSLFNGLRPVFKVLDPSELNTFVANVLAVVQGRGPDLGSILDKLRQVAALGADRSEVIGTFVTALGGVAEQIEYKSPRLNELVSLVGDALQALAADIDTTASSVREAARSLKPVRLLLDKLQNSYYGNYADVDRLLRKYIPATNTATDLLASVPGALDSLTAAVNSANSASFTCKAGAANPGPLTTVLLAGAPVVMCR